MKGYERATKEEIYDRLRIEANCHAQIERIIHLRHLCNLNLEEAADVTNLSISTLSRYENEVTKCSVQRYATTIRSTSISGISPSTGACFS